jgi:GDPmannose 4,6-dehydratase
VPSAFITGITGQDGSYLTELLLEKGYVVHGLVRRTSTLERSRIEHLRSDPAIYGQRLFLHYGDLTDSTTLRRILIKTSPDELYHFAGQSQPGLSFEIPESTVQETAMATLSLLEILRDLPKPLKTFLAASSEVFGTPQSWPQTEETPFRPVNPYGCAKAFAANLARVYRQAHGLHICVGMAYNHESPRRGEGFVTRKITATAARIALGSDQILELGNLSAERDWGYAPEYVEAMWRMLQHPMADDYVLATAIRTSVRDFARTAFESLGMELDFSGSGKDEIAKDKKTGRTLIRVNPKFFRPTEAELLIGNPEKAKRELGWEPQVTLAGLVQIMAEADWKLARQENALKAF